MSEKITIDRKLLVSLLVDVEAMKSGPFYELETTDDDTVTIEWPNLDFHMETIRRALTEQATP